MLPSTAIKTLATVNCDGLSCNDCPLNMAHYVTKESTHKPPFLSLCLSTAFSRLTDSPKGYLEENGLPSHKALNALNRPGPSRET